MAVNKVKGESLDILFCNCKLLLKNCLDLQPAETDTIAMRNIARTISEIKAFRNDILNRRRDIPLIRRSLADVKRVAIINSSSRSGSSLMYALLRRLPQVYALTGEATPFYKLNTCLDCFNSQESDRIPTERIDDVIDFAGISRDFFSDLFLAETEAETGQIDCDAYFDDLMLRISLQWTDVAFDPMTLRGCISQTFERYSAEDRHFSTEDFFLLLLERLSVIWPQINPFYYDIGTDKVALHFPYLEIPSGPPNSSFNIEEPPFILLPPRRRPILNDLSDKTLLLKSTVDCYRMNLLERIFPNADIRIIHLVRNPAAAINGIYDGWHHRGFFSHNLERCFEGRGLDRLRIKGYSDIYPFGATWWNFDLPIGWQSVADRDLVEVCAFQWHSANSEILENLAHGRRRYCRIHYEDIIRSAVSRRGAFERLLDFIGVPIEQAEGLGLGAPPVVQSTMSPQLYRWKKREDMIAKVLDAPWIRDMAESFNYRAEKMEDWL